MLKKNTKPELRAQMLNLHARLQLEFPELFSLDNPKPFRIGFYKSLTEKYPDIKKHLAKRLMGWLTARRNYLMACAIPGVPRWDFDGECGTVSAGDAEHARARFVIRNSSATDPWPREKYAA